MTDKKSKIEELLTRGVENIYPSKNALESELLSGKKLKLYQGFDPTGPDLHIGHMVGLMKLRQFQKLGHKVIFLIGDLTATIGDPSGKSGGRAKISSEEVENNAKNYKKQASRILDFDGKNPVEIKFNSEWYDKMSALDFAQLTNQFTYSQIIERDLFQKRQKAGQDVFLNELIYPMLQAHDSVAMDVDLEIGGDDQMFNMMMGRKLMKKVLNKEKFVLTVPLLTDSSGKKIGKTEGNAIALDANPSDFYGMIMSLSDDVIVKSFEYITEISMDEVKNIEEKIKAGENPMIFKKKLAYELTRMLNSESDAKKAQEEFERVFAKHENPENMDEIKIVEEKLKLIDLIAKSKLVSSNSEIRRLIEQSAVQIDNIKKTDFNEEIEINDGMVVQVGKRRFCKIIKN